MTWKYKIDSRIVIMLMALSFLITLIFGYNKGFNSLFAGLIGCIIGNIIDTKRMEKKK